MHFIAPFFVIIGIFGVIAGLLWLIGAGSDEDGAPDKMMFLIFGGFYVGMRVMRALARDPMSVLPAFGFLFGGGALIWLGAKMW